MKSFLSLAIFVAALFARPSLALANAVLVQNAPTVTEPSCTFTNTPQVGNTIIVVRAYGLQPVTTSVTDSNSVALSLWASAVTSTTTQTYIYAYNVPGPTAPSKTYTYTDVTANVGSFCTEWAGITGNSPSTQAAPFTATPTWTSGLFNILAGGVTIVTQDNTTAAVPSTLTVNGSSATQIGATGKFYYRITPTTASGVTAVAGFGATNRTGNMALAAFTPTNVPTTVQSNDCVTASCSFGAAPGTGSVVSVQFAATAAVASDTVKDSNSVALTLRDSHCAAANALCVATFDYIVPTGTPPTATYTITATGFVRGMVTEVSSAVLPGFYSGTTAASGSINSTLALVPFYQQLCFASAVAGVGTATLTINNGTNISTVAATPSLGIYSQAATTATGTCTYSPGTSLTTPGLEYAEYVGAGSSGNNAANRWIGAYERPPLYFWPV